MKKATFFITAILTIQFTFAQHEYPATKTVNVTDTLWGVAVDDPYRWLEDLKNQEVLDWFKAQSNYTNTQMAKIPGQDKLIQELKELDKIVAEKIDPVDKAGGKYFYNKRLSGEQTAKLYYREGESGEAVLLFDPQQYMEGKTMDYEAQISDDGSKVLLSLSEAGSEVSDLRMMDVATKTFLPDVIKHSWGWFAGNSNTDIIYIELKSYDVHDPEYILNRPCKLHVLGTPVSSDIVLASAAKYPELDIRPEELIAVFVPNNSPWMFLGKITVDENIVLYCAPKTELKNPKINWKSLATKDDKVLREAKWPHYILEPRGDDFYFRTTKGNPYLKIMKTSLEKPSLETAAVIFEGTEEWKISSVAQTKDYLIINKSKNELVFKPSIYEFETGKLWEPNIPLSGNITINAISYEDNEVVIENSGWNIAPNAYSYNIKTGEMFDGLYHKRYNGEYPNLDNIVYEEIEIPSHDGTMVPLSLIYDKTLLKRDGTNICLMTGYGAYGDSESPYFTYKLLPALNRGVVIASAHVRGGGEKGNEWHLAGMKTTKPNTWKDMNACAEWLINNKYSSAQKLGIYSGSAGGILIGRAITERPDLYQVAMPYVGCLNTLRMKFTPGGLANVPEFGTVEIEKEFYALLEMDAYQHIEKGVKYPAQLVSTGFNDPRVVSWVSGKYAAKMQANNGSDHPVFLNINYKGGHSGGSTVDELYSDVARHFAFLFWQCGHPEFQPRE